MRGPIDVQRAERPPTKGERTRRRLLDGARRAFEEHGFLDTRIIDIAAEADIAVGSFYTYFDSKEDIFRDLVQGVNAGMFPRLATPVPNLDPVGYIEATNRHFIDFYRRK